MATFTEEQVREVVDSIRTLNANFITLNGSVNEIKGRLIIIENSVSDTGAPALPVANQIQAPPVGVGARISNWQQQLDNHEHDSKGMTPFTNHLSWIMVFINLLLNATSPSLFCALTTRFQLRPAFLNVIDEFFLTILVVLFARFIEYLCPLKTGLNPVFREAFITILISTGTRLSAAFGYDFIRYVAKPFLGENADLNTHWIHFFTLLLCAFFVLFVCMIRGCVQPPSPPHLLHRESTYLSFLNPTEEQGAQQHWLVCHVGLYKRDEMRWLAIGNRNRA